MRLACDAERRRPLTISGFANVVALEQLEADGAAALHRLARFDAFGEQLER